MERTMALASRSLLSTYLPTPSSSSSSSSIVNRRMFKAPSPSQLVRFGIGLPSSPDRKLLLFKSKSKSKSFSAASPRCELSPALKTTLDKVVTSNKVVLFMKGTKDFPQCGFSNTVVQILNSLNVPFETVNILENELLRQGLKEYSSWPTFPQLYIDGEFFGGCDITVEAYQSGQLQEVLEKAMCS